MNIRKLENLGLWAPFLLSLVASTQLSAKVEDTVKETFTTSGSGLLSLELQSAGVDIDTYNGSEVSIEITRTLKRGDQDDFDKELEKLDLTFEQSGNDIRCIMTYDNKLTGWSLFGSSKRLNFKAAVRLPKSFDVITKTSGGGINLSNLEGDAELRTSGGGIVMESVDGNVIARTSGGGIRANNLNGDVEMRTSGGSIKSETITGKLQGRTSGGNIVINDVHGDANVSTSGGSIRLGIVQGNLEATTSGGGITASIASQPTQDCYLKTSGGSITVAINREANLAIDASTSGGGVSTQLLLSTSHVKRSSLKGTLNAGGPLLKTRTSGGSIHLNSI